MDSDELFLLVGLVAVLPYIVVSTTDWLKPKLGARRFGAHAPL